MINFSKKTLIFSILLIFIFGSINLFQSIYNIQPEHYRKQYEFLIDHSKEFNGIILGTSHATHSIQPSILNKTGLKFYNFSLNGSNPLYYYRWYNEFIHNKINIKYCLFSVDFFIFDRNKLTRRFEQDVEYFPSKLFVNFLFSKGDYSNIDLIVNRFPFLKYRSQIKQSLQLKRGNKSFNIENYDRGYISFSCPFDISSFVPDTCIEIDSNQLNYFKSLIKQMLLDDVKIIFVITPEYGISENKYDDMRSLKIIDSFSEEFDIPILNFNKELKSDINNNVNYFSDWGHMNHRGAKVFSIKLSEIIYSKNLFLNK
jgi:hypothetical protein